MVLETFLVAVRFIVVVTVLVKVAEGVAL